VPYYERVGGVEITHVQVGDAFTTVWGNLIVRRLSRRGETRTIRI
jgi:hypothetical protein